MGNGTAMALRTQRFGWAQRHFFITVTLLVLGSFRCFGQPGANELIQKVEKRYNEAHTLSVNFVESYSFAGHTRPPESGKLTIKKQGKMRWDYSSPRGKLFISDGKTVFLYTSGDNRVEKVPLKSTEDVRAPLAFLLGRLDLKREFGSFKVQGGEDGEWLDAAAKSARTPYADIRMLISADGEIKRLEIDARDGSVVGYSFSDEKLNVPVPDSAFQFQVPPGAEVVNSVDIAGQGS